MPSVPGIRRPIGRPTWLMISFAICGAAGAGAEPKSGESTASPEGKVVKSLAEWKKLLTKEQFRVTRLKGTETAYSGKYWKSKKDGIYQCVCCGQPLFDAQSKFDSGTGWPSFWTPIDQKSVTFHQDDSQPEVRTEVLCSRCDAHLGHVFQDGPAPTGLRFCMNSASLKRVAREKPAQAESKSTAPENTAP